MLAELAVRDLGVIEDLAIVLGPGMTAVTGETGAGKTLVVGAIGLLAGARADPSVVRPGAAEATVQGRFIDGDDELVLTRVVPRDGRSRSYVDGRLLTVGELAEHGSALVSLHGQHAHVALLSTASQRSALDRFAGVDTARLHAARAALRAGDDAVAALGGDAVSRAREVDFLHHQLAELEAAGLTDADEDARLATEEALLADADGHRAAAASVDGALTTDGGARDLIAAAMGALAERPPFTAASSRLAAIDAELDDIARDVRSIGEAIEHDPERLAAVQARRMLLTDLRRRYTGNVRGELADLFAVRDDLARRLGDLEAHDERARAAEAAREAARDAVAVAAAAVAARRREAAPDLAAAVEARLADLALPGARFGIDVAGEDPADDVTFLLAPNRGIDPAPLAKAASGGELARVMLALRLVVGTATPTLVFDEVDAGVGGTAALAVGRALSKVAEGAQVLVVTHLPQVAAFADAQVGLDKVEDGATTAVRAAVLDGPARVRELSRMLSGLPGSDTGREHAEELLVAAARERARR